MTYMWPAYIRDAAYLRCRFTLVIVAFMGIFALLSGCQDGKIESPLDPSGHLVFVGSIAHRARVYSINLDEKTINPRALTPSNQDVLRLVWGNDEKGFLYQSNNGQRLGEWHMMPFPNAHGPIADTAIWDNPYKFFDTFSFSSQGKYVAGVPLMGNYRLRVFDVSGTHESYQLGDQPAVTAISGPAWSPNESKLVFVGALGGDINYTEIFTINRDGSDLKQITDVPDWISWFSRILWTGSVPPRWDRHKSIEPRWSPDGKWIAFMSFGGIYRVHPEGGAAELIVKDAGFPAWSPDGKMLAYVAMRGNPKTRNICVSMADGTRETKIFSDADSSVVYSNFYWIK